jgi:hypothetical protein
MGGLGKGASAEALRRSKAFVSAKTLWKLTVQRTLQEEGHWKCPRCDDRATREDRFRDESRGMVRNLLSMTTCSKCEYPRSGKRHNKKLDPAELTGGERFSLGEAEYFDKGSELRTIAISRCRSLKRGTEPAARAARKGGRSYAVPLAGALLPRSENTIRSAVIVITRLLMIATENLRVSAGVEFAVV